MHGVECVSSSRHCLHNQEKSNEKKKKKKHSAVASFKYDANANATAWEGVKAILVNSLAADHSLS